MSYVQGISELLQSSLRDLKVNRAGTEKEGLLYLHIGRQPGQRSCGHQCWQVVAGLQLLVGVEKQPQEGSGYMGEADRWSQGGAERKLLGEKCQLATVRPARNKVCSIVVQGVSRARWYLVPCNVTLISKIVSPSKAQADYIDTSSWIDSCSVWGILVVWEGIPAD